MIDTHCHLDQSEFAVDFEDVYERALRAGLEAMITVAVSASSSEAVVRLSQSKPNVFAAVGIHPNNVHEAEPGDWDRVLALVEQPRVVAVGETGLDRHWNVAPLPLQQDYFDRHLRLSQATGLPFIVHTRECEADVMSMLEEARRRGPLSGVMHSYTGGVETAARCVELGLYVSFAGMLTFKKSDELRRTSATVPIDRVLVETDSPYLSPHPLRGKRNEPANVVITAQTAAVARGMPEAEFRRHTTANARRLFTKLNDFASGE